MWAEDLHTTAPPRVFCVVEFVSHCRKRVVGVVKWKLFSAGAPFEAPSVRLRDLGLGSVDVAHFSGDGEFFFLVLDQGNGAVHARLLWESNRTSTSVPCGGYRVTIPSVADQLGVPS